MSKRNLAIDFDDVIAAFNQAYIAHHNVMYAVPPLQFDGAHTYDLTELYGVDMQTMVKRMRRFCHEHHHEIAPYVGVDTAFAQLRERHHIHIVMSRCESLSEITKGWLLEFDLLKHISELHFTNTFGTLHPERMRSKLEVCRQIEAVALVEDAPTNAKLVADGGTKVLMPERPWNATFLHERVHRFRDWSELPQLV